MSNPGPHSILIVVAAVVVRDGRVLLTRRVAGSHLEGMWEFPGGKVERSEEPQTALVREIAEELGVDAAIGGPFAFLYHAYPGKCILLLTYLTDLIGMPRPLGSAELGWFTRREVVRLEIPPADVPIFDRLRPLLRP